jgi:hypothetical protein
LARAAFYGGAVTATGLIEPPPTNLAGSIEALLATCDSSVVAHSHRSYQFAAAFAAADGVDVDAEVLYLGTVLHDVGLAGTAAGPERFEVRGANLVRDLLHDHGIERDRAANVWDVIAMHASTPLARHKSTETRYANRGIALAPEFVRAVLDRWPRHDFASRFEAVLAAEVRAHPDSVRMSWLESVAAAHVPGFVATDFLAGLRASSTFA